MRRKRIHAHVREEWRAWLERHHATESEIWLVYVKKHTGKPSVSYAEAVEEALCFGWIDGVVNRLDGDHYMQRSPRGRVHASGRSSTASGSAVSSKRAG